jgi:PAS domain S-box-containing protein
MRTDVDHRNPAEALHAGERSLLEAVALGLPLRTVLDDACHRVEGLVSASHCSILLTDPDDMTFQWAGASRHAWSDMDPAEGSPVHSALGPCGMAAAEKTQVIVAEMASESRWTRAWCESGLRHGLHACWSTPILSRTQEALGTLTIYRSVPGNPDAFQCDLIGQFTHIASIAIERARSDMALKRSEESFRAIWETTPECMKVVARDGTLLRINSAGVDMSGAPSEAALLGKSFYDFVAPEHRDRYVEFNQSICSGGEGSLEFDIITLHGERHHMETHAAPMHGSDGSIVQLGVTRDVTARKLAHEQLHRSAALMAKVEQVSLSGSFCWHPASGETIWSEQLYRIFGVEPGTRVSMGMATARTHPADLHLQRDINEQARCGKDLACDQRLLMSDGSVKYVRMRAHATRDSQGRLEYIGAAQDVTERRESEEALDGLRAELAHMSRVNSLGALTASIAHEINQPLAGIMTNASTGLRMLNATPPNVEGALGTVRRTLRDGNRVSEVMTRLRALFGKKAVTLDAIDLVEAAHDVIELLRSEIRKRRIVLRLEAAGDLPPVTGDRVQLQQVMLNLFLNAMEAMQTVDDRPREMLVRIEWNDAESVRFIVTDSGVGFEPKHADKLFDAFYTTRKEGMGIGLFVSRSIIESHGGRLWATSNEHFGATFSFSVPCHADHVAAAVRPGGTGQSSRKNVQPSMRNL